MGASHGLPSALGSTLLTIAALSAFAANSILTRAALRAGAADGATFSFVRIVSGAIVLTLLVWLKAQRPAPSASGAGGLGGSQRSAFWLFVYAVPFSFAYTRLSTGTGALLLFGAVQATMLTAAIAAGERPRPLQWLGLASAAVGLVYLVLPGVSAPSPIGSALMGLAGIGWGLYSLAGRSAAEPLLETRGNFVRCIPWVALVIAGAWTSDRIAISSKGLLLASASGAVASGIGYAIWYAAVRGLTATIAATVQLAVPVVAAFGGVLFMAERITLRLAGASALILGGVGIAVYGRQRGG